MRIIFLRIYICIEQVQKNIKYVSEGAYNAPQIKSIKLLEKSARATSILVNPVRANTIISSHLVEPAVLG